MTDEAVQAVRNQIEAMWATLAKVSGKSPEEIAGIRRATVQRVEMRRRYLWYRRYQQAVREHEKRPPAPWYRQWLLAEVQDAPQIDSFAEDVAEQTEAHVILSDVGPEVKNYLGKQIENFPGLVLRASTHRFYPYRDAACHVLGHLSRVDREDLRNDPNVGVNELRQYLPNDMVGRTGLESLCEPALRGSRGRIEQSAADEQSVSSEAATPGQNVRMTIDIELQSEMQRMFAHARTINPDGGESEEHEMHGAAVVIDVPTGQVRALVSYPAFDLNELDSQYNRLRDDEINSPLLNRATQYPLEPGSTVKPIVGIGAASQGLLKIHEGIECTGYLIIRGKRYPVGRCWTASQFGRSHPDLVAHHQIPSESPHHGSYGNPDGSLILAEALERSCNVYFETVADRLGLDGLTRWYKTFGLGRTTGLGIAESRGRLPDEYDGPPEGRWAAAWMAGIGQGSVAATPIQMANVAATIARNGVWVRPHLTLSGDPNDQVDLKLPADVLAAVREGMTRVVNSPAGTGMYLKRDDVVIAGKTGTAQAAPFTVRRRDASGQVLHDEAGRELRERLTPSTSRQPNPLALWYRGTGEDESKLNHAWFIGFAPADHPQIAFAVLVEYGGSGGRTAAPIARQILEACIEHGYLALSSNASNRKP